MIQSRAVPQSPVAAREDRRIEWLTVSKAAERSRRMRTEERVAACAVWRDSLTARSAVSVECPGLKPGWWGSSRLFWEKKAESWLEAARSMVLERNGRSDTGR